MAVLTIIVIIAAVVFLAAAVVMGVLFFVAPQLSTSYKSKVKSTVQACQTTSGTAVVAAPTVTVSGTTATVAVPAATATINGYRVEAVLKSDAAVKVVQKTELTGTTTALATTLTFSGLTSGQTYIFRAAQRYVECGYTDYGTAASVNIP